MNALIAILLLFALLGAVDKIIGGKLGVAEEFDRGLAAMGPLCLPMSGVYCVAVAALGSHPEVLSAWGSVLPFDPSLLAGALLAPDLGGYPIASQLAASPALAAYSGAMLSSLLGCLISFVLPTSLGSLESHEVGGFMRGILWGIVAMPAALAVGGLLAGIASPLAARQPMAGAASLRGPLPGAAVCPARLYPDPLWAWTVRPRCGHRALLHCGGGRIRARMVDGPGHARL